MVGSCVRLCSTSCFMMLNPWMSLVRDPEQTCDKINQALIRFQDKHQLAMDPLSSFG